MCDVRGDGAVQCPHLPQRHTRCANFQRSPYGLAPDEIEQTWKTMQGRPEFADIEELTNNQNERFLFSTQYLTRRYAKAISDVDEFCD